MVSTDGKFLTTQKVKQLIKQLDRYLSAGAKLSGKTGKDLKLINAMMEFYTTKPLADARGVSWHPPRTLLAKISAEN